MLDISSDGYDLDVKSLRSLLSAEARLKFRTGYVGLSLTQLLLHRAYILAGCVAKTIRFTLTSDNTLSTLRVLRNSRTNQKVLIIASGPSANRLDSDALDGFRRAGGEVVAINHYHRLAFSDAFVPDFILLADPAFSDSSLLGPSGTVWDYLREHADIRIFMAQGVTVPDDVASDIEASRVIRFNFTSCEGWTRNVNPLYPRAYVGLGSYAALAIAQFMNYGEIFIAGIDNSIFKYIQRNNDGSLGIGDSYAYAKNEVLEYASLAAALSEYAKLFADLRFFDSRRIKNTDPNSLILNFQYAPLPFAP